MLGSIRVRGWRRRAVAFICTMAAATSGLVARPLSAGAATACTQSQLVPTVVLAEANQGLQGYGTNFQATSLTNPLAWGKDTLVKVFLSMPPSSVCDTTNQSITLAAGSTLALTVGNSTRTLTSDMGGSPVTSASQAPAANSAADVVWRVPGEWLAPATTASFPVNFAATIKYTAVLSKGATPVAGSKPSSFAAQFDKPTTPLRVLVVPMGDFSAPNQFTSNTVGAVAAGMQNLSRLLPVSKGVASLTDPDPTSGPPPGLRYTINAGVLDLGARGLNLISGGTFCGTRDNFSSVSSKLQGFLTQWNIDHPTITGTRALGVIDETIVSRSCAQGWAAINGTTAWTTAYWQSTSVPRTAAIAAMELGHTLGLSAVGSAATCGVFAGDSNHHSADWSADRCGFFDTSAAAFRQGHAFNVATAGYLMHCEQTPLSPTCPYQPNREVTRFDPTDSYYADDDILFEAQDYQFAQCQLGGTSPSCVGTAPVAGVSAAGGTAKRFVISGEITDVSATSSRATIGDSYWTDDSYQTQPVASRWGLVYYDGSGAQLGTREGILVSESESEHGGESGPIPSRGHFVAARPLPTGTQRVDLVDSATIPPAVLYSVDADGAKPIVTTQTVPQGDTVTHPSDLANLTNTPTLDERAPGVSSTGLVAFGSPSGIRVAPLANVSVSVIVAGTDAGATNVEFNRDGSRIAYEDANGDIFVANVSWSGSATSTPVISGVTKIYDSVLDSGLAPAHHPTWAPPAAVGASGDRLAVEYFGDLYIISLGGAPLGCTLPGKTISGSCQQITATSTLTTRGTDTNPSWAPSGDSVVFERSGALARADSTLTGGWAITSTGVTNAHEPTWANGVIGFQRNGNLFVFDPSTSSAQQLTFLGSASSVVDQAPSIAGTATNGKLVFQRANPSRTDIVLMTLSAPQPSTGPTYAVTATDADDAASSLRAEFSRVCPNGTRDVLAAAEAPTDTNGQTAYFELHLNANAIPTLGCTSGSASVQVSDGYWLSPATDLGPVPGGSSVPVVTIAAPQAGSTPGAGHLVGFVAAAYDADARVIPSSKYAWQVTGPTGTLTFSAADRIYFVPPAGPYTVKVAVTDPIDGTQQSSAQRSYTVVANRVPNPPVIASPPPGAIFKLGDTVGANGSASDPEEGALPSTSLDWVVIAPDASTRQFARTAAISVMVDQPGTWTLILTATDSEGVRSSTTRTVKVAHAAVVNFSPTSLNVPPLPSDPKWVTVKVRLDGQDLSTIDPATVRIVQIGSRVEGDPGFPTLRGGCDSTTGQCTTNAGWSASGPVGSQVGSVQFDRIALAQYLFTQGYIQGYVPVYVAGSGSTFAFRGADPAAPNINS